VQKLVATEESKFIGFATSLNMYKKWRDQLGAAIANYQSWVEQQEHVDGEQDLRVYELIKELDSDKLTIALVAEFSRGKTELLNAIFFADFKQRLLPSTAGRTTMCPTELRYDEGVGPCIKLLPIETRKTALTISEYKHTPVHWTTIHILKPNSVDEVREAFQEVTKTKKVNVREAEELGLYDPRLQGNDSPKPENGMVEVPVWRHAIINYPHPLLKKGLVILDTPGLNALGAEPELTLSMLPNAHAVLFVLAADIGVTRSDLEVWKSHLSGTRNAKRNGQIVVLNKIDALWDELHNEDAVNRTLAKQIEETSRALHINKESLFPVSASKGLIGKVKADDALLKKSGLPALESKLAEDIIPSKHEIIRSKIVFEISGRVASSKAMLESKLANINKQLSELKQLGGKNLDAIKKMVAQMRREKQKYDRELEGFRVTRKVLSEQAKVLLGHLSMGSIDQLIKKARHDMHGSWTTHGLKNGMATFFQGSVSRMEKVRKQADEIKKMVDGIYHRLHTEYGLAKMEPASLPLVPYFLEIKKLENQAEEFRNSPVTVMTEQHFVIKKFFITLVSQARNIFSECNNSARNWFQAIVSPVFIQIRDHKATLDRNLEALKKIHNNLDSLGDRIAELERDKQNIENQLKTVSDLLERIHKPIF